MSWSVGVSSLPADELFDALDERFNASYSEPSEGISEQFETAKEAVDILLRTIDGDKFNCSLGGHKHSEGDALDAMNISLSAVA